MLSSRNRRTTRCSITVGGETSANSRMQSSVQSAQQVGQDHGTDIPGGIGAEAEEAMIGGQTYPATNGNGTAHFSRAQLGPEDLMREAGAAIVESLPDPEDGKSNDDIFEGIEREVVTAALKRTKGNKQAAANLLGLYRPRLYGMIKRHGLEV